MRQLESRVQDDLLGSIQELGKGLTNSLNATAEQLEKLQEEITTQAAATGEAQGDYRVVMESLRQLQEEFSSRLSEESIRDEIQSSVADSVDEVEGILTRKLQTLEERYEKIEDEQQRLIIEQDFIEELIDENQETYKRYKPGYIEVLRQKIDELEAEEEKLQKKLIDKNAKLDEKEREIGRLRADDDVVEREEIQKKLEKLARREAELASKEQLAAERDHLQKRLDELEALRQTYEENQERVERNRSDKRHLEELRSEKEKLNEEIVQLSAREGRQKKRAERLEEQKGQLNNRLDTQAKRMAELEGKLDELRAERDELKSREEDTLARRDENIERQKELDRRKVEIERQRQQALEGMRNDIQEKLAAREAQLEAEYRDKRDALRGELTAEIKEQFEEEVRRLREERDRLTPFKKSYDELAREYQKVTEDQRQWEVERDKRERERAAQEDKIEKAEERHKRLESQLEELETARQKLKNTIGELHGKKSQIGAELEELEERRERRRGELEADKEGRLAPIYSGIDDFQDCELMSDIGAGVRAEAEWLDGVMGSIEEAGFYFPPRLVKAFHTSLKIAEWAPLTVLAGVSGTGKSALPGLYSRYGGLHHQLISVKPNWDSPQDLFGFFNYMDNRYKATDFLKALVQSQQDRDDGGFDDQMLLVLLDEMNLARVELYFSDFLSKLEARRDSEKTPTIGVDIGSGFGEEPVVLGKNVLFVGTMNEDETTNSLSDKVIDRGNVISFPRPKTLRGRDGRDLPEGREERLPKKTWQSWIVTPGEGLDEEVRDRIRDAMNQVNRNLRKVNRAIGHRVLQAIENYVANHPDVRGMNDNSDDAWKRALEDQIAQKIMPKLRGVETDTEAGRACLGGIREVLDDYAEELVDDFEQARKTSYGAFRWSSADYLEGGR